MKAIILFDGVCNLCNGAVNFIIERDNKKYFQFAALQSTTGKSILEKFNIKVNNLETIILVENEKYYVKSTAALRIAKRLPSAWSFFYLFILIPVFLRDGSYSLIAKNRYRWFGKKEQCRIPTLELQKRFV